MNSLDDVPGTSRELLIELLSKTLLPNTLLNEEIKDAAEKEIKAVEATENFAIELTEILLDSEVEFKVRELAAITLQSHVETHWKNSFESGPLLLEIKSEDKERMKEMLPNGLREPTREIRSAVAETIAAIAQENWPENWPGLYDVLIDCLSRENDFAAQEVIEVLRTCICYVSSDQLPHVGPAVLQAMYQILQSDNYSFLIRSQAVEIFTTIFSFLAVPGYCDADFIRQTLLPVVPMFCEKFMKTLKEQNESTRELSRLETHTVKAIKMLTATLPKCILDFLPEILTLICRLLADRSRECLDEDIDMDSDGEAVYDCDSLAQATIEFIEVFMDGSRGSISNLPEYCLSDYQWFYLQDCLPPETFHLLIASMEMNDDQTELWTDSLSQFLIEGELNASPSSVRGLARNLLVEIVSRPKRPAADAFVAVILKRLREEIALRADGATRSSWKSHEAYLLAFSIAKNLIVEKQISKALYFDVVVFLEEIVLADINDPESHPLLIGRCLCLGGSYAEQMPLEMKSRFLEAVISALESQQKCTKICAAIAAKSLIYTAAFESLLKTQLPALFDGLFDLGSRIMSPEGLRLVLESFARLFLLDRTFVVSVVKKMCILSIAAFLNFHHDFSVLSLCEEIFRELTLCSKCIGPLQARLVPKLVDMMSADASENPRNGKVALDVLRTLVEHSPQPLSSLLIQSAFPAACDCILSTVDHATLQSGSELLRVYLSVAEWQIISFRSSDNKTGPHYVFQVATRLLKEEVSVFRIDDAYELVKSFVKNDSTTLTEGVNMPELLQVVLNKLQCTDKIFSRRLLTIFAHFINTQFKTVHNFLTAAAGPTGEDSMTFVVIEGLCKEHESFESDDRKTVNMALSKILEHAVTNHESILRRENQGTEYEARTPVPILVEICKLVSSELRLGIPNKETRFAT